MDDKKSNRRSSILKRSAEPASPTMVPQARLSRRISFSENKSVKKFREGAITATEWEDSYEEKTSASNEAPPQPVQTTDVNEKENYMDLTQMLDTKASACSSSSISVQSLAIDMDFSVINSVKTEVNSLFKPMQELHSQQCETVMQPPQNRRKIRTPVMTRAMLREKRKSDEMDISDNNTAGSVSFQSVKSVVKTQSHCDMDISDNTSGKTISPDNTFELLNTTHIVGTKEESVSSFNQSTIHFNEQIDTTTSEGAIINIERKKERVVQDEISYNERMDELLSQNLSIDLRKSLENDNVIHDYKLKVDRTSCIPENMQKDSLDLGDFNTESFESRIILNKNKISNRTVLKELDPKEDLHGYKAKDQTLMMNDTIDLSKSFQIDEDLIYKSQIDRTSYSSANMLKDSIDPCSSSSDTFENPLILQNPSKRIRKTNIFDEKIEQEREVNEDLHECKPNVDRTSFIPDNMKVDSNAQCSFKTESFEKDKFLQNQKITQDLEIEQKREFHEEFTSTWPNKSLPINEDMSNDSSDPHSKTNITDDSKLVDFTMPFCSTRLHGFIGDFNEYDHINISETSDSCLKDLSFSVPTQSGAQSYNTDDLCHLNAEQLCNKAAGVDKLKTIHTAMQSLHLSGMNREALELSSAGLDDTVGMPSSRVEPTRFTTRPRRSSSDYQCRKCKNCKRSIQSMSTGSSGSLLKHDPLGDTTCLRAYRLDFSMYDRLANTATVHNVLQAFEKRRQAAEAANKELLDQNVPAPDFLFLYDNKMKEKQEENFRTQPNIKEEPIEKCIFPCTIDAEFAIENKLNTDVSNFTYMDRFFYQGTIILRSVYIPSVMVYMEFMPMRLLTEKQDRIPFLNIYTMLCPHQTAILSPIDTLRHNELLSKLPTDLIALCPTNNQLSSFIDRLDSYYCAAYKLATQMNHIAIIHDTYLRRENGEIFLQKIVHNMEERTSQKFVLDMHNMNNIGPQNVFTKPARLLSPELNDVPVGLTFLETFLSDPMKYLL